MFCIDFNDIEVLTNLDFNPSLLTSFPDGFLFFENRIDIYADTYSNTITLENQVNLVTRILNTLWSRGVPAVASCDYELALPNKGGYKSKEIPGPKNPSFL